MAKVLTEQPRRFSDSGSDPRQFGDGAGLHAAIPFDLVRWINNLRSYRDPALQFLHNISVENLDDNSALTRIRYRVKAVGFGDATCMLGQAPIYVPPGATKLRWSLGTYRWPTGGVDPPPLSLNLVNVTMYLCSEPLRQLRDGGAPNADNECMRTFFEGDLTGAWTKNTAAPANGFLGGSGDPVYDLTTSNTWTDFAPRGVNNINDRLGTPWSNLIVTANVSAGLTHESIWGAELSVWFEYDDAELMFDDAIREAMRNGKPAMAQVMRRLVAAINEFAGRPRPIHSWWGGADIATEPNTESHVFRRTTTMANGMRRVTGVAHVVPIANALGVPKTGLTLNHLEHDQVFPQLVPQTPGRSEDINTPTTDRYPQYVVPVTLFGEHEADYVSGDTTRDIRVQIGESPGTYGPRPTAGVIIERRVVDPVMGIEALPLDPYAIGSEVIGESVDPLRDLRAVRSYVNMLARDKSMHFSWGVCRNGTGTFGYNVTANRGTDYAYVLNRAYGSGAGVAPGVDGPGIKIPTRWTAFGRETTVRAYVSVYAHMTGNTNTGSLGYSRRDDAGGMTGFFALTHTPTISGTTPQWYPAGNFNAAADPYATLNANPSYDTDNFVLCGTRNGTTDDLIIIAWTICIRATRMV